MMVFFGKTRKNEKTGAKVGEKAREKFAKVVKNGKNLREKLENGAKKCILRRNRLNREKNQKTDFIEKINREQNSSLSLSLSDRSRKMKNRAKKFAGGIFGVFAIFALIFGVATILQKHNFASAAGENIDLAITTETGTPDFDDLDENAENDKIRTNDYLTWNVQPTFRGAQTGAKITISLPNGVYFDGIPQFCDAENSSLTPNASEIPVPHGGMTSETWKTLPAQTLICGISNSGDNVSLNYPFAVKIRPEIPNGTEINAKIAIKSNETAAEIAQNFTYEVVSAPKYDISKTGYYENNTANGPMSGANQTFENAAGETKSSRSQNYTIVIFANTQKGISPATEFTFTDDISAEKLFPELTAAQIAQINANPEKYGVRFNNAYGATSTGREAPFFSINSADGRTAENSVRNSGTISCAQNGGAGTAISCTLKNGDYSAWTYPTKYANGGNAPNKIAVAAIQLDISIPVDTIIDFGIPSGNPANSWTLRTKNTLTNFSAKSLSGQNNVAGANKTNNDARTASVSAQTGYAFSKIFAGIPGVASNTPSADYISMGYPGWAEGPANAIVYRSGEGKLAAGQDILSMMFLQSRYPTTEEKYDRVWVACDYWDNTKLNLHARNYPAANIRGNLYASGGKAVWVSGEYLRNENSATDFQVWYGSGANATAGSGQGCGDDDANWYENPADVPGNDATLAQQGIYTAVNIVRVGFIQPAKAAKGSVDTVVSIGLRAKDGLPAGAIAGNWAATRSVAKFQGFETPADVVKADAWNTSNYDPNNHLALANGDRVLIASIIASLDKKILESENQGGNWTDNSTEVTINQTREFQITPKLSALIGEAQTSRVVVEDCIPAGFTLTKSSENYTTARNSYSDLTCKTGETYVQWNLGAKKVSDKISPITYEVKIEPTVSSGTYENVARISAVGDTSSADLRTDAQQVRVLNPSGVYISKSPANPQIQVNSAQNSAKEDISWRIDSVNVGPVAGYKNLDLIDILPKNGVNSAQNFGENSANSEASDFSGNLTLKNVEKISGGNVQVFYSLKNAQNLTLDANDASNSTNSADENSPHVVNSANWISVANLSEIPANATALRFKLDGDFTAENQFSFKITLTPSGNFAGEKYVNSVAASVFSGGAVLLGPIQSPVETVGAKIGNFVWRDENADGIQDETEKGIANLEVKLSGKDDLGNAVNLTTKTDENGEYSFENLRAADENGYEILIAKPSDFPTNFAISGAGEDEEKDSNADKNGEIQSVKISAGEENESFDAGILFAKMSVEKTSNPASGEKVFAGDKVFYTVKIKNDGSADLENVEFSDNLAEVLRFANLDLTSISAKIIDENSVENSVENANSTENNSENADENFSENSAQNLENSAENSPNSEIPAPFVQGEKLIWRGNLARGETLILTYSAQIKSEILSGNLQNSVIARAENPDGDTVLSNCQIGDEEKCFTNHEIVEKPAENSTLPSAPNTVPKAGNFGIFSAENLKNPLTIVFFGLIISAILTVVFRKKFAKR